MKPGTGCVRLADSEWQEPLRALLRFSGWSIDDIVRSPRAALEVRVLWKAMKESDRLSAAGSEEHRIETELWWREMGSPVACPVCGSWSACACTWSKRRPPLLREWLPAGTPPF